MSINATVASDYWKRLTLSLDSKIQDAASILESYSMHIVLIVGKKGELIGTISDGDIRRGLLQGYGLHDFVSLIVQSNPLVVPVNMDRSVVLQIMETNKIHQIPVVDDVNKLVGLHLWEQVITQQVRPNTMVIMAGGMGTRLRPHTETCPKPMLELGGKPMLEHIIERAKLEGFRKFVVTLNYLGHMIEDYFGSGDSRGIEIQYTKEESPLGTAGAISLIKQLPKEPFVVTNGDVITNIRYGKVLDFHNHHGAEATMSVRSHEWQNPFGVVNVDGFAIVGFEEKPVVRSHINAGVYVLDPKCFASLESGAMCDMPTLFDRLNERGLKTVAYAMHEEWLDVGRPDDYKKAENTILLEQ